jgi:hypothetical protein
MIICGKNLQKQVASLTGEAMDLIKKLPFLG